MNGLMKNFNVDECAEKDRQAQEFIKTVNPYTTKPSLGIDLRSLAKYAKENNVNVTLMSKSELQQFALNIN